MESMHGSTRSFEKKPLVQMEIVVERDISRVPKIKETIHQEKGIVYNVISTSVLAVYLSSTASYST